MAMYVKPNLEIIKISTEEVITTSPENISPGEGFGGVQDGENF